MRLAILFTFCFLSVCVVQAKEFENQREWFEQARGVYATTTSGGRQYVLVIRKAGFTFAYDLFERGSSEEGFGKKIATGFTGDDELSRPPGELANPKSPSSFYLGMRDAGGTTINIELKLGQEGEVTRMHWQSEGRSVDRAISDRYVVSLFPKASGRKSPPRPPGYSGTKFDPSSRGKQ